jgi:hypothetical protein
VLGHAVRVDLRPVLGAKHDHRTLLGPKPAGVPDRLVEVRARKGGASRVGRARLLGLGQVDRKLLELRGSPLLSAVVGIGIQYLFC